MSKPSLLLISLAFIYTISSALNHLAFFSRPYNHKAMGEKYTQSQYVTGSGSSGIGDDGLYTFAGYYYIQGGDPMSVNFENPPLGKYLIGLSILTTGNENFIYILYALLLLAGVYLLSQAAIENQLLSAIAVFAVSLSPFFRMQFLPTSPSQQAVTMLDLPLTMFLVYGLWSFFKAWKQPVFYSLAAVCFGLAFVTKFFPGLFLLIIVMTIFVYIYQRPQLKFWLISLLLIPIIYIISYGAYFRYHSLIDFIAFHKYMIKWRMGNPIKIGNIILTIFTGNYRSWWNNDLIKDHEWNFLLPITVVLGFMSSFLAFRLHQSKLMCLSCLSLSFLLYLIFASVGVARYLLPIYPVFIVQSVSLAKLYRQKFK